MNYLSTFHTHYGALQFNKYCNQERIPAKMAPVPRELSASCGVCVRFKATCAPDVSKHEDMDRCYQVSKDEKYTIASSTIA